MHSNKSERQNMKLHIGWLGLAFVPGFLFFSTIPCLAQTDGTAVTSAKAITQAAQLLGQNQPAAALAALKGIPKGDAAYGQAKALSALGQYALGDQKKFLQAVAAPEIQTADLPEGIREDLDYKRIDTLFYYRKFDELLPRLAEYQQTHPNSDRLPVVAETQMAVLYEQGMKNLEDATLTQRGNGSNDVAWTAQRMQNGQEKLEQFLKLAAGGGQNGYQTLANRDLSAEVVKVMAALGGEDEALKMVPVAEQENMALALVKLHNRTDANADANLARMTNFLNRFPNTKYRQRVVYDMGGVAFEEGWRLVAESKQNIKTAAAKRAAAAPYLDKALGVLSSVKADKGAGISDVDVLEAQKQRLCVYFAQRDWTNLCSWAAQMVTNVPPGKKDWIVVRLYDATGLTCEGRLVEAARELDEILAVGFKGNPSYDGPLLSAAEWRINVARLAGNQATARKLAQQVQSSGCYDSLKRGFVKDFREFLSPPAGVSK